MKGIHTCFSSVTDSADLLATERRICTEINCRDCQPWLEHWFHGACAVTFKRVYTSSKSGLTLATSCKVCAVGRHMLLFQNSIYTPFIHQVDESVYDGQCMDLARDPEKRIVPKSGSMWKKSNPNITNYKMSGLFHIGRTSITASPWTTYAEYCIDHFVARSDQGFSSDSAEVCS